MSDRMSAMRTIDDTFDAIPRLQGEARATQIKMCSDLITEYSGVLNKRDKQDYINRLNALVVYDAI